MSWICAHGHKNTDDEESCFICSRVRPETLQDRKSQRNASKPVKQKAAIKKVSEKRKVQNDAYSKARLTWIVGKRCQCCGDPATVIHHRAGRSNEMLLEKKYWLAVCSPCHDEIHANPVWAASQGYMLKRSV
jgi:hypothetical protein